MCVDASISSCASEILVLPVGDVDMRLGVTELLSQPEVDNIDLIGPLAQSHQKVVGLDIAMDKALAVNVLYP